MTSCKDLCRAVWGLSRRAVSDGWGGSRSAGVLTRAQALREHQRSEHPQLRRAVLHPTPERAICRSSSITSVF